MREIVWEGERLTEEQAYETFNHNKQVGYQLMHRVDGAECLVKDLRTQAGHFWLEGKEKEALFLRDGLPALAKASIADLNRSYKEWFEKHVVPLGELMNKAGWKCDW